MTAGAGRSTYLAERTLDTGNVRGLDFTQAVSRSEAAEHRTLGEVWVNERVSGSSFMVAGAGFELWKRPLMFEFLITY